MNDSRRVKATARPANRTGQNSTRLRRGLSMVEVVISTMLVAVVLVGAMDCVGGVLRGRVVTSESVRAMHLAQQLMVEILGQSYQEPVDAPVFGRESESSGDRLDWDDVDDYDSWSSSPPEAKDGTALSNLDDWQREVTVHWVDPNSLTVVSGTDQGVKRITVLVRHNGELKARLESLSSDQ